jgi:hypothetical protein
MLLESLKELVFQKLWNSEHDCSVDFIVIILPYLTNNRGNHILVFCDEVPTSRKKMSGFILFFLVLLIIYPQGIFYLHNFYCCNIFFSFCLLAYLFVTFPSSFLLRTWSCISTLYKYSKALLYVRSSFLLF